MEYETPCQRPGWFEEQLARISAHFQAIAKLYPRLLSDLFPPKARTFWRTADERETGLEPTFLTVEYGDCVFAYTWANGSLTSASGEQFEEILTLLPKTVRKRKGWRNRIVARNRIRRTEQDRAPKL